MLIKLGYYPRTHSLKELINKLSEVDDSLKDFSVRSGHMLSGMDARVHKIVQ